MESKKQPRTKIEIISSALFASTTASVVINPFSVTYFALQKQSFMNRHVVHKAVTKCIKHKNHTKRKKPLFTIIKNLYQTQGLRGFYRGVLPNMAYLSINEVGFFLIYEKFKQILEQKKKQNKKYNNKIFYFLLGGVARTIINTCTTVLEFQASYSQAHMPFKELLKQENVLKKMWKGYKATIGRNFLFSFIFFGTLESIKESVKTKWDKIQYLQERPELYLISLNSLSSAIGAVLAASITTPLDVIKIRNQLFPDQMKDGVLKSLYQIPKQEGIKALFTGNQLFK